MSHRKFALIPACEPGETLVRLGRSLLLRDFAVVVVDDGSKEAYRRTFRAVPPPAIVLSYPENRGKGHALKFGMAYIQEHMAAEDVLVTLDSDGQHTAEDADRVAEAALRRPEALTLGVRTFGPGTPARSRFGNAVTCGVYRLSSGVRVRDTQTGLRAFGAELLPALTSMEGERYEYEMNMLLECPRRGIPIQEIPIQTIYLEHNSGSHFHPVWDSLRIYNRILKFAVSSLAGFVTDYSLYSLLVILLSGMGAASVPISNVAARVVSASVNFSINRRFVFRSGESALKTGGQYFLLAACILAGNTVLLSALTEILGVNKFAAKLVTEITFFTLSFLAQHFWIFRGNSAEEQDSAADDAFPRQRIPRWFHEK